MIVRRVLVAAAAGIPALLYLLYVVHYSIDVPIADDWGVIPLASHAVHHQVTLGELWSQYGDTRLFVGGLLFAAFGMFDHLNEAHIVVFSAEILIATFVLLLFLFRAYLRRPLTFLSVFALGVVWFSVADVQNALWSFQLAWYVVVFFFVAMAYVLLIRRERPNLFLALGIVAAVLASLTEVQGFAVWAVGLICLVWVSPWARRTYYESAIWISAALLTVAMYAHRFDFGAAKNICVVEGGPQASCSPTFGLLHPVQLAKFWTVLVGNVVPTLPGQQIVAHQLLGTAILVVAVFVVVQSIRERRTQTGPLPVLLIVFAVQFDLMIALSRLGQGIVSAGRNSYTMPNVILLAGIVIYASARVPKRPVMHGWTGGSDRRTIVPVITLSAFLVVQFVVATQFGITNGRIHQARAANIARVVVNLEAIPGNRRACYFHSVVAGPRLRKLNEARRLAKRNRLSLFQRSSETRYLAEGPPRVAHCDSR